MRILALDIGERRIGVAAADDQHRVAIPITTLEPQDDPVEAVLALVREQRAERLVVGLPISLNGSLGPQGQRVQAFVRALATHLDFPVETWDERLTSVEAARRLRSQGRPSRRSRRTNKTAIHALAAAIILQAYLDTQPRPGQQ
jgi:putative Holliday junction resolvase